MGAAGQISIDDAIDECERESMLAETAAGGDLERLGESHAWGWTLISMLERQGWLIHVAAPFAGAIDGDGTPGIMVVAAHPDVVDYEIKLQGRTVADCATPLLIEAGKWTRTIANARRRREESNT
jgi:hypothetical protein